MNIKIPQNRIPQNNLEGSERLFTVRPRSTFSDTRGTYSRMRVLPLENVDMEGITKYVFDSLTSDLDTDGWGEFLLTDVQCSMSEKVQVMEVFGDQHVAYYFGKSPTTFNLSGILFDDVDNDWFTSFINVYENYIRGSQLARKTMLLEITLPNIIVIGSITQFNYQQNSLRDTDIPFNITVLAKTVTPIPINIPNGLSNKELEGMIDFKAASSALSLPQENINLLKKASNVTDLIKDPFTSRDDLVNGLGDYTSATNLLGSSVGADAARGVISDVPQLGPITLPTPSPFGSFEDSTPPPYLKGKEPEEKSAAVFSGSTVIGGIMTTLTGFKASVFSPVFGFLSSITKVVKEVTGNITRVITQFTDPVNSVIRDIRNITNEVTKITSLLTKNINDVLNIGKNTIDNINSTISALKRAKGAISKLPDTVSASVNALFRTGRLKSSSPVFKAGKGKTKNVNTILQSTPRQTRTSLVTLPSSIRVIA